jgi:hypothetical protein
MRYPGGFENPEMIEIGKKHRMAKMIQSAKAFFTVDQFADVAQTAEHISKIVSQSSMVSLFEKPKFRDAVKAMPFEDKEMLVIGLKEFLHGDEERGFNLSLQVMHKYRVAKWPMLTVCPCYYRPTLDLLIKPTTVKNIIKYFEIEGLIYHSTPSYDFYKSYRKLINSMKQEVDPSLSPDNAAFSGFLMTVVEDHSNAY